MIVDRNLLPSATCLQWSSVELRPDWEQKLEAGLNHDCFVTLMVNYNVKASGRKSQLFIKDPLTPVT